MENELTNIRITRELAQRIDDARPVIASKLGLPSLSRTQALNHLVNEGLVLFENASAPVEA